MEKPISNNSPPKPIITRHKIDRASTYSASRINGISDKKNKKKVQFIDRAKSMSLCTVFNYEQVDVVCEDPSPKTTSCACLSF